MNILKLKSPAKLNLYLRILNKRPDGYHNIVTVFERIDLCDEVMISNVGATWRVAPTIHVTCSDPSVPTGPENLAYKAAQAIMAAGNVKKGVSIRIKKRIPVAAGLGGGSSNAATVLLGLNRLWKLRLSRKDLMKIGAKIGADVNFFLSGAKLALGTGRGEATSPLRMKRPLWHVLVAPEKGLSTKCIYEYWDKYNSRGERPFAPTNLLTAALADVKILHQSIRNGDLALLAKALHNDLQEPAQVKDKTIIEIRQALMSCGAEAALLSGSGSCVYGVAASGKEAMRIRQRLAAFGNGWQVFITKTY